MKKKNDKELTNQQFLENTNKIVKLYWLQKGGSASHKDQEWERGYHKKYYESQKDEKTKHQPFCTDFSDKLDEFLEKRNIKTNMRENFLKYFLKKLNLLSKLPPKHDARTIFYLRQILPNIQR